MPVRLWDQSSLPTKKYCVVCSIIAQRLHINNCVIIEQQAGCHNFKSVQLTD